MATVDYPFARVIGVELIKELHEIAERNLVAATRRLRSAKVELICADLRALSDSRRRDGHLHEQPRPWPDFRASALRPV